MDKHSELGNRVDMPSDDIKSILDKLLKRRAEIAAEATRLDALIGWYETQIIRSRSESDEPAGQLSLYAAPTSRSMKASEIARVVDAARRIILSTNRPMKRGELVTALEDQGFALPGADKNKVLGTNLWRSGKFRQIDQFGYWPKDTPRPRKATDQ